MTTIKRKWAAGTALAVIGVLSSFGVALQPGQAQMRPTPFSSTEELVAGADMNGNGMLSPKEIRDYVSRWFDWLDTKHQGKISLQEYEAPLRMAMTKADGSDKMALERDLAALKTDFSLIDKDHNGTITRDEYAAWAEQRSLRVAMVAQGTPEPTTAEGDGSSAPIFGSIKELSVSELRTPLGQGLVTALEPLIISHRNAEKPHR